MKGAAVIASFMFWIVTAFIYWVPSVTLRDAIQQVSLLALLMSPVITGLAILMAYREGQWSRKEEGAAPVTWRRPPLRRVK